MGIFRRGPKKGVLRLTPVDHFECDHVIVTDSYGSHPARLYAICPKCAKIAVLDWSDPKGRFWNRLIFTIPIIWQAGLAFAAIGLVLWFVFSFITTVRPH